MSSDLFWRLVVGCAMALVGVTTARTGWLGLRGRLRSRPAMRPTDDVAFAAGARVAGLPMLVAGAVAVLGAVVAVLQPTMSAMFTVAGVVLAGLVGIGLATRQLVNRAVTVVRQRAADRQASCRTQSCESVCATCPLTGTATLPGGDSAPPGNRS